MESCDYTWGYKVSEQRAEGSNEKSIEQSGDIKNKAPKGAKIDKFKVQTESFNKNILTNINMNMKKGDFLAIVGKVGCGKS